MGTRIPAWYKVIGPSRLPEVAHAFEMKMHASQRLALRLSGFNRVPTLISRAAICALATGRENVLRHVQARRFHSGRELSL